MLFLLVKHLFLPHRAKVIEHTLQEVADRQHINFDRLVELVKENDRIIDAMKDNLRKRVVHDIVKVVVDSDKDNDMRISKVESKMMALNIRTQLQEYGVEFDEQKFYKVLSVNPCVSRIISLVQKLVPNLDLDSYSDTSTDSEDERELEDIKAVAEMFSWSNEDYTVTSDGSKSMRISLLSSNSISSSQRRRSLRRETRSNMLYQRRNRFSYS